MGPTPARLGTSKGLPEGWQAVGEGAALPTAPSASVEGAAGRASPTLGPAGGPSWRLQATTLGPLGSAIGVGASPGGQGLLPAGGA